MISQNRSDVDGHKFFCDTCGKPVPSGSSVCPHCGAGFSGVRCPSCGHQGLESEFKAGCPACGFLASGDSPGDGGDYSSAGIKGSVNDKKARLPDWLFKITLVFLLLIIGGLMFLFGIRFF